MGRFLSADTIVPNPANPQSFNRYAYALNNPLKYSDPSGHCIPEECPWVPDADRQSVYGEDWSEFTGMARAEKLMQFILILEQERWSTGMNWLPGFGDIDIAQAGYGAAMQNAMFKANLDGETALGLAGEELLMTIPFIAVTFADNIDGIIVHGANYAKSVLVAAHRTVRKAISPPTQSHHIIQHAAAKDLPGYTYAKAPTTPLLGPSTAQGTPHYRATRVQDNLAYGGGNYAAERRLAYRALRTAGLPREDARYAVESADIYFFSLGVTFDTQTRIPGTRR